MRHYNICLAFNRATSLLRCSNPSYLPSCTPSSHVVAFQEQHPRRNPSRQLGIMHAGKNNNMADGQMSDGEPISSPELEIEKKFHIPNAEAAKEMEQTLASLGFKISRKEEFADWYFDLPAPHWQFSLQDCWFRYREKKIKIMNNWGWRGAWQVKRGKKDGARENDGITVYEELQGKAAKELILDMLAELSDAEASGDDASKYDKNPPSSAFDSQYSGHDVPYLAGAERLVPFARLETFRTCYETTDGGEFGTLKVDIDKTNFGFMVGEVEAVLNDVSEDKMEVEAAKENIRKLVDLISSENESHESVVAIGKLEYFLINNHRDHYDACVESGVMMN